MAKSSGKAKSAAVEGDPVLIPELDEIAENYEREGLTQDQGDIVRKYVGKVPITDIAEHLQIGDGKIRTWLKREKIKVPRIRKRLDK